MREVGNLDTNISTCIICVPRESIKRCSNTVKPEEETLLIKFKINTDLSID